MPSPYLSKSDFKACFDCRTKLFYRKNEYPTNLDEDEYLKFLADGGFMVEFVAKAKYPGGTDLADERDPLKALARTRELVAARKDAVVFEAAAIWDKFYARIDILRREGDTLHLIEVKSSSINSDEENDPDQDDSRSPFLKVKSPEVATKWQPYLLDVAFQAHVLQQAFPGFKVRPWLCVVDKAHLATENETLANFRLSRSESNPKARPQVEYTGNLEELKNSTILCTRDVSAETALLMPEVIAKANALALLIGPKGKVTRVQESVAGLYKVCRKCEFRLGAESEKTPHGFAECWGEMAKANPHILDLHQVTRIGSGRNPDPVPALIKAGKASLLDLNEGQLGTEGTLQGPAFSPMEPLPRRRERIPAPRAEAGTSFP